MSPSITTSISTSCSVCCRRDSKSTGNRAAPPREGTTIEALVMVDLSL